MTRTTSALPSFQTRGMKAVLEPQIWRGLKMGRKPRFLQNRKIGRSRMAEMAVLEQRKRRF